MRRAARFRLPAAALACTLAAAVPPPALPAPAQVVGHSARIPGVPFEELERRAGEAAAAGRIEDATRFYRAGVELNPRWADGWWRLALIHFDAERFAEARAALRRLMALEGDTALGWALLGLSEYKLGEYDPALASLSRAAGLGVPREQPLGREALHHQALLLVRAGQFAPAASRLAELALIEADDPELVAACGLLALRIPRLPAEIDEAQRELVTAAGRATHAALAYREQEARRGFEELLARFPKARGVHYAFGLFLTRHASGEALPMLRREVELHPDHLEAQLEIAFAILDRGEAKDALSPARAAARLAPESALARLALGRALVANERQAEGIRELEQAERLGPDVRDVFLALAQAYAKAGRTQDVARARARLIELDARIGAH